MAKGFNSRGMRMPGSGGINMNMIRQAQKLSEDMQKTTAVLDAKEYTAQAGGGTVSVTINGKFEITSLTIAPEAVNPEEVELLQDTILVALKEAHKLVEDERQATLGKLTGGKNFGFGF